MNSNKKILSRKSLRLKKYDYSTNGMYFITIRNHNSLRLLGNIQNEEVILNDVGEMVKKWWLKLGNKFPDIILEEYIIMPNHIHGILNISPSDINQNFSQTSISDIVKWYKAMSTNEYSKGIRNGIYYAVSTKLWQRNYYDRIIRNESELLNIRNYIKYNPMKPVVNKL